MQTQPIIASLSDKTLENFFSRSGEAMAEEAKLLGDVAQEMLAVGMPLTNKNLIICLIKSLDCADGVVQADIIRKTLEIVVSHTSDDF
ncbi:biofilm development regulator YmgB/AriR family protein [Kluyvera ascorbata]|uniref:biofilm development regulator YmgB/AriR family protein n=1 Tax=Kluyvera ascorbata TaxID=51288 RepID=UPI0028E064FC|nr:biofilm development regulator YmgB/AriR family protein [Kluyvera ascorbata]MDT8701352.1 biofilm development regulator YmgB/AriR family protein [Kluyvera ascorbata]